MASATSPPVVTAPGAKRPSSPPLSSRISSSSSSSWLRTALPHLLIFTLSVAVFSNSLWGAFCFDDAFALLYNGDVHHKENSIKDIFFHDFWGHDITKPDSHKSYRPLTTISFRMNYLAFLSLGGNETRPSHIPEEHNGSTWQPENFLIGLHLVNVLLHAATSCYVYKLAKDLMLHTKGTLLLDPLRRHSAFSGLWEDLIPISAGALFATHPAHVEAVASIVGRAEMLSALLCLIGFDIWRHKKSWFAAFIAIAFVYASVLCKEITFAMYGVFIVWDTLKVLNSSILRTLPYQMGLTNRIQPPYSKQPKDLKQSSKNPSHIADKSNKESSITGAGSDAEVGGSVDEKHILSSSQALPGSSTAPQYAPTDLTDVPEWNEDMDELEHDEIRDSEDIDVNDAPTAGGSGQAGGHKKGSGGKKMMKKAKGGAPAASSGLQPSNVLFHLPHLRGSGQHATHPSSSHASGRVNSSKLPLLPGLSKSAPGFYNRSGYGKLASAFFIWRSKVLASLPSYLPKWVPLFLESTVLSPWFMARQAMTLVTILIYLNMRRSIMGDSMVVQNYRRVENPLAYIESKLNLVLSAAYLHANYLWILIYPVNLSCDWSFNCIHLVSSVYDEANLFTLASYLLVIIPGLWSMIAIFRPTLGAKPVVAAQTTTANASNSGDAFGRGSRAATTTGEPGTAKSSEASSSSTSSSPSSSSSSSPSSSSSTTYSSPSSSFALPVLFSIFWGVLFFLPASNLFFFVGTMLAERVLYLPSITFCILIPIAIDRVLAIAVPSNQSKTRLLLVSTICVLMISAYSHRTWNRNVDWTDNQHLFEAAERVCPQSAKVHFNLGILRTQQKNFTQAAYHFRRTLDIEPNYCEVAYRRALMHLGQNSYQLGVLDLHESLNCIYTRAEGANALFKVYQAFINADPTNANKYAEAWNNVVKKLEPIIQEEKDGKRPIRQG